jgi:hypothetical protein
MEKMKAYASFDECYEYASAARPEQYFGALQWDRALPLLQSELVVEGHKR